MIEGQDSELNEYEATRRLTGHAFSVNFRNYENDREEVLKKVHAIKIYKQNKDYRTVSREDFVNGKLDRYIDWERTDRARQNAMYTLPRLPHGYEYNYNKKTHKVERIHREEDNIIHTHIQERMRQSIETSKYNHTHLFKKAKL